jgi:hypothetical protein
LFDKTGYHLPCSVLPVCASSADLVPEIMVTGLGLSSGFQSSVPHFSRGSDYTTAIPGLRFACRSPGYVDSTFRGMSITSGAGSIPKTCGSGFLHHWARYPDRTPRSLTSHEVCARRSSPCSASVCVFDKIGPRSILSALRPCGFPSAPQLFIFQQSRCVNSGKLLASLFEVLIGKGAPVKMHEELPQEIDPTYLSAVFFGPHGGSSRFYEWLRRGHLSRLSLCLSAPFLRISGITYSLYDVSDFENKM